MAQDWYVGIGGKARRIVKAYIGVGGKAREIVAGYVGVGGKARQFYSVKVKYKGIYSTTRYAPYGAENGSYAIFLTDTSPLETYAFNKSLVKSTVTNGITIRPNAICRIDSYACFSGNRTGYALNASLVKTSFTLSKNRYSATGCSLGTSGIIGYGHIGKDDSDDYQYAYDVDFFSNTFVRKTVEGGGIQTISSAINTSSYAIFAGGAKTPQGGTAGGNSYWQTFDKNYTRREIHVTNFNRYDLKRALVNNTGVFGGGQSYMSVLPEVKAINNNLTISSLSNLTYSNSLYCSTYIKNYAIYMDRRTDNTIVDVYDKNLVKTTDTRPVTTSDGYKNGVSFDKFGILSVQIGNNDETDGRLIVYQ